MRKNIKTNKKQNKDYTVTIDLINATENRSDQFAYNMLSKREDVLCWSMAANLMENIKERSIM